MKYAGFFILVLVASCQGFREQPAFTAQQQHVLLDTTLFEGVGLSCRQSVVRFYRSRAHALFWRDSGGVDSLIYIIENAGLFGLRPEDYHASDLRYLRGDSLVPGRASRIDLLLTDAYLAMLTHLRHGRLDPHTLRPRDLSSQVDEETITAIRDAEAGSVRRQLHSQEPKVAAYQRLKHVLRLLHKEERKDSAGLAQMRILSLNMERWRWQGTWPDRYILVNIPAFTLRVVENDSVWLGSRVIVGKRETPTPVMESIIRSFIIYPYWHVPYSIATTEILPALQDDRSYLNRNNFDVLDRHGSPILADTIQWDLYDQKKFPFILRQREGSENSMGIIRFNFVNRYNVYLHDTNSKRLFNRTRRDFSHGCIRVEKAVSLAHYLVREDDIYVSPEDLDQYLSLQQRLKVDLRKPIPLKLGYFTAEVLHGSPEYYQDIYSRDSVMMRALYPIDTVVVPL